ncbi:MAG: PQQ-like beta-propeller repeat protein [Bacteroidales bacterium]|nr:PQQ-like beta-propeller repeat protein [Bacteroidales bacterium]
MKIRQNMRFVALLLFSACMANVYAQDWPQYLGPERNSTSPQENILRSWPEEGPEVLWNVDLGIGYGGPVVKDGKVYLLDRDDQFGDKMRCFDLSTGKELWKFEYEAPGSVQFPGSRSVPAVDGDYVYSVGTYGDLYCIDINTHKPVWNVNVWTDFGGQPGSESGSFPTWAISQCPLVYGDLLIVASQAPGAGVVAYDKLTGEISWKTPSLGGVGYVSPAIVKIDGDDHVVMVTASGGGRGRPVIPGKIVGIDPGTGDILWENSDWVCGIPIPSAVDAGENRILVLGGYDLGALMIKVDKGADGSYGTKVLIKTEEFGDQTKPPILHEGYFYAQYGTNNTRDGLSCMSMDGEIMWKTKRDPDFNKGSMILADGLILATDGAKTLYLIEPDPTGFKPLASAEILTALENDDPGSARFGTQNWAPIALADGKLLIRDQARMLCVKVAE